MVLHFHRYWVCSSKSTVRPKMESCFQDEPVLSVSSFNKRLVSPGKNSKAHSLSCLSSVQFSSVAQSCPTRCDPMNCSTPGLPVHHQLLEFTQTHAHRVRYANSLYVSHYSVGVDTDSHPSTRLPTGSLNRVCT